MALCYNKMSLSVIPKSISCNQFSSDAQLCLTLCDPLTAACQVSLPITNSWSLLKLVSIKLVMPSNHLILCHPLPLLPSIFPRIRAFSNVLRIKWPEYWNFSFSISSPMNIQAWFPFELTSLISLQSALNKKSYYFLCFVDEDTRSGKSNQ